MVERGAGHVVKTKSKMYADGGACQLYYQPNEIRYRAGIDKILTFITIKPNLSRLS